MAKNDLDGVWRTVGGRRIFIKDGQDLESAMKESGKFRSKKNEDIKKEFSKENIKEYFKDNGLELAFNKILSNKDEASEENIKKFERWTNFQSEHFSDFDDTNTKNVSSNIYMMDDNLVKLSITKENNKLFIDELYIEKQKQGVGTKVVNILKKYAEANNLELETMKELESAQGFWNKVLGNKRR